MWMQVIKFASITTDRFNTEQKLTNVLLPPLPQHHTVCDICSFYAGDLAPGKILVGLSFK